MSSREQALVTLVSQLALSFDGAILGFTLAYAAFRSFMKLSTSSSSLRRLRCAPSVSVSGLRALLEDTCENAGKQHVDDGGEVVVVRGHVEARSAVDGNWKSLRPSNVLVSQESGDKAVVIQRTQSCLYNEWKGFFGWSSELRTIFGKSRRKQESTSIRMVPFILVEGGRWPHSDYVVVNLDGSRHALPLTTVYHQLKPIDASPYTFLQALFGHEYPVGLLDEEKILPLGKDITAVGICSSKDGVPEIKSCEDLPYFLSDMTKDQMVVDLAFQTKLFFWSGIVLGTLSIGILGYSIIRNWSRWIEWRQHRRSQQQRRQNQLPNGEEADETIQMDLDEETGDVLDGQLCVICLMRRRRSAFIPCGHLVCCQRCAISVEGEVSPKCPLCRQAIRNSIRIFES